MIFFTGSINNVDLFIVSVESSFREMNRFAKEKSREPLFEVEKLLHYRTQFDCPQLRLIIHVHMRVD